MGVFGGLSQRQEIDTKMLERPAMSYQPNRANSLASNHSGRNKHGFFFHKLLVGTVNYGSWSLKTGKEGRSRGV